MLYASVSICDCMVVQLVWRFMNGCNALGNKIKRTARCNSYIKPNRNVCGWYLGLKYRHRTRTFHILKIAAQRYLIHTYELYGFSSLIANSLQICTHAAEFIYFFFRSSSSSSVLCHLFFYPRVHTCCFNSWTSSNRNSNRCENRLALVVAPFWWWDFRPASTIYRCHGFFLYHLSTISIWCYPNRQKKGITISLYHMRANVSTGKYWITW